MVWYFCKHCGQWFYIHMTTSKTVICPFCGTVVKEGETYECN